MSSIDNRLDQALLAIEAQGMTPVTIVLSETDYEALAAIPDWPVTTNARGELRFRSTAVFKARDAEAGSIVGRGLNGATHRLTLDSSS
jgi:hypothetical protein